MIDYWKDHGVDQGLNAADKQALINVTNEADKNQSTVKTNLVNALNAVSTEKVLGLTAASTWADIQVAIPQVKTGKKIASGTGRLELNSGKYEMRVNGLSFIPSKILVTFNYKDSSNLTRNFVFLYGFSINHGGEYKNNNYTTVGTPSTDTAVSSYYLSTAVTLQSDGFLIQINSFSSTSFSAYWTAIE
ncbi:hypothetical protein ACPT9H_00470 [Brevibacillus borstelensis]|uniref:hypothetical protein n=1 Tax=Brevibacillus borstelensis TaxID=45462 RepID=UPI003CE47FB1